MRARSIFFALLMLPVSGALQAQAIKNEPPMRQFNEEEVAAIAIPALAFDATANDREVYDKYFYFHRPETSFDEAFADILECDSLGSGLNYYAGGYEPYPGYYGANYGVVGGAIGSMIGSAIADAIFGSAERRRQRRSNMRNCMYFKEYDRYGLRKNLWQEFNFEEGNSPVEPEVRLSHMLVQARVASGPRPQKGALQP